MAATPWGRFGAIWLLAVGLLLLGPGILLLLATFGSCSEPGSEFACDVGAFIGGVSSVLGTLHLASAWGVWKRWLWARLVGAVVLAIGLLISLGALVSELWWVGSDISVWSWFVPPIFVAGYAIALVSLAGPLLTSD